MALLPHCTAPLPLRSRLRSDRASFFSCELFRGAQFHALTAKHQHQQQHQPRRVDLGRSSSSWTSSWRTQRNHLLLQQLWPRQHQPWWTPGGPLAAHLAVSEQAEQDMAADASAWIEGCGIEVSFIWGGICLLFIGSWPWHTSCRTPAAAATAPAGERTTTGHGLRRGCCVGREIADGVQSEAHARRVARCRTRNRLRPRRPGEGNHPSPFQGRPPPHRPPTSRTISHQPRGTRLPSWNECHQRFAAHKLRIQATADVASRSWYRHLHFVKARAI